MKFRIRQNLILFSAVASAAALGLGGCTRSDKGSGFQTEETGASAVTETESVRIEAVDPTELLKSLDGVRFTYSGGGGSWTTSILFGGDGTFTGSYRDKEENMTGKKYPKGTVYKSSFSGRVSVLGRKDELTYKLKLDDLTLKKNPGQETISKKVRTITTNAYGLDQGDSLTLYMPGFKTSSLPKTFRDIIKTSRKLYDGLPKTLTFCGIYNETQKSGFTSENYLLDTGGSSFAAYAGILSYYKDDIDRYNWEYSAHTRPTALCDINGDGTKELFFFTSKDDDGPGILHIYTYRNKKAVEVEYPFKSISDGSDESLMFTDENTGTGTSYVIYQDKDKDSIWIYRRHGDGAVSYYLSRYELESDGSLKETKTLKMTQDSQTASAGGLTSELVRLPLTTTYDDGSYDDGSYDDGSYDDGAYDDGSYDDGSGDDGSYDNGDYDDGSYDGGDYDDGSYDDGSYDDGDYDDGSYDDYDDYSGQGGEKTDALSAYSSGTFTDNGKEVSAQEGSQAFSDGFDRLSSVLLYSSPTGDTKIWDKVDDTSMIGLSYDDMYKKLTK